MLVQDAHNISDPGRVARCLLSLLTSSLFTMANSYKIPLDHIYNAVEFCILRVLRKVTKPQKYAHSKPDKKTDPLRSHRKL